MGGRFFEIDELGNTVWEYVNPVNGDGVLAQEEVAVDNNVFRCTRLAGDYPGLQGRSLVSQGYIETGSTFDCELPSESACMSLIFLQTTARMLYVF